MMVYNDDVLNVDSDTDLIYFIDMISFILTFIFHCKHNLMLDFDTDLGLAYYA